jgi:hypothetical protein
MHKFIKLPVKNYPRNYALMRVNNQTKLACQINGEWVIDKTCKSINEMLQAGLVRESAITGWISNQALSSH